MHVISAFGIWGSRRTGSSKSLQLHVKFKASLGYIRHYLKNIQKINKIKNKNRCHNLGDDKKHGDSSPDVSVRDFMCTYRRYQSLEADKVL